MKRLAQETADYDISDLELESERDTGGSSQIVRKNISLRLKTTSKPRGRPKKVSKATEKGKKAASGKKYADEAETGPSERGLFSLFWEYIMYELAQFTGFPKGTIKSTALDLARNTC